MTNNWQGRTVTGLLALAAIFCGLAARAQQTQTPTPPQNWEPTISAFEQQDKLHPVAPGGIVFTGSSSIVRWSTMAEDLKPLPVLNRGFGGSQYTDVNQYAERIVVAYKPKIAVVYAGDNDLAAGTKKTPQSVAAEVQKFVEIVHGKLPQTWIIVMAIKPSYLRWLQWPQMREANTLIQTYVKTQPRVQYVDVAMPLFDANGELPRDLFVADGLHMTPKGYAIWTAVMKPILVKQFAMPSSSGVPATNRSAQLKPLQRATQSAIAAQDARATAPSL